MSAHRRPARRTARGLLTGVLRKRVIRELVSEARPAFGGKSRRVVSAARRGAPYCAPPMVLLATPGFISMREKCRLLPQVLPNAKLRQIAQIKNLTELLNYLAPREWIRTIDRTGNNRLLYRLSYRGTRLVTMGDSRKKVINPAAYGCRSNNWADPTVCGALRAPSGLRTEIRLPAPRAIPLPAWPRNFARRRARQASPVSIETERR
jgi:hypothetical protein